MHVTRQKISTKPFVAGKQAIVAFSFETRLVAIGKCSMVVGCFNVDKITFLCKVLVKVTPFVILSVTKLIGTVVKNVVVGFLLN